MKIIIGLLFLFFTNNHSFAQSIPQRAKERAKQKANSKVDQAIDKAENLFDKNKKNKEAAFFICASYAIKGRLYAEREKWVKAAWAGKQALKYLDYSRGEENINPELLFGDGRT